jgi:hypothetical protein
MHSFLVDPNATATQRALSTVAAEQGIQRYLADMGANAELYQIAMAATFEAAHFLTRSELYDLGIDRRENLDSGWILGNVDSRKGFVIFATALAKAENAETTFNRITLGINCYQPRKSYVLAASRKLSAASARMMVDIRVSSGAVNVMLDARASSLNKLANNDLFQVWRDRATRSVLETLLTSPTIKVAERQRRDKGRKQTAGDPPPEFLFSNVRGPEALKAIISRCADQK